MTSHPPAPEPELIAGLASPAKRALANAGFTTLKQLTQVKESQLASLHGIGPNALTKLRAALAAHGWSFQPEGKDQTK